MEDDHADIANNNNGVYCYSNIASECYNKASGSNRNIQNEIILFDDHLYDIIKRSFVRVDEYKRIGYIFTCESSLLPLEVDNPCNY